MTRSVPSPLPFPCGADLKLDIGVSSALLRLKFFVVWLVATFDANTVMGDAVNLAARLMGSADEGEIICDEYTAKRCVDHVQFETCPPLFVKGKVRPVHPYRPVEWITRMSRSLGVLSRSEILIGRQRDKKSLGKVLDTLKVEKGGTLMLLGEHGVGKSAFLHMAVRETAQAKGFGVLGSHGGTSRFLDAIPGRTSASTDWSATCQSIGILDSFNAWEGVLMQALSPTDALRRNSFFNYGESAMTCRHALDAILPTDLRKYVPAAQVFVGPQLLTRVMMSIVLVCLWTGG